jgi:hypothetical protein
MVWLPESGRLFIEESEVFREDWSGNRLLARRPLTAEPPGDPFVPGLRSRHASHPLDLQMLRGPTAPALTFG